MILDNRTCYIIMEKEEQGGEKVLNRKGRENNKREGLTKTVVVLVAAVLAFAASGVVGAQEKAAGTAEVISLNVTQMNLQDVLRLIAEKANLNIIVSKEVSGVVSVRLKNVNLWDALGAILETNDFSYREEKGIIRVVKLEEILEEQRPMLTRVIPLKHATAEDMKKASEHLLSNSGTMEVDVRSNTLVITDVSENIENVRLLVAKLDTGIPVFNLMGILSTPDRPLAMINSQILGVGETIGDFTVSEIGEDSVTMRRGDETVILRLTEEGRASER